MEGEPVAWDGPVTAGKAVAWCSYGPSGPAVEHPLPAKAVVWVKTALLCAPYTAVKYFYCHDGRSLPVNLGLSL